MRKTVILATAAMACWATTGAYAQTTPGAPPEAAGTPAAPAAPASPVAQDTAAPAPAPVVAAAAPEVAPAPPPECELHIWPAARVAASTQGVGAGFGLLGALIDAAAHADKNKRDQAFITATLDAKAQAKVLSDLDLPKLLHLPPTAVVMHDQGIDLKTDETKRLTTSNSKCYYEFVVRGLSYFQNLAYRAQMRTFMSLRKFDGDVIKADFRDSKHENLEVKLPKEGEDTGPATQALLTAFRGDVEFFGNKFLKQKQ